MNILQVITRSEAAGAQTVVASLAAELHAQGHEVAIATGPEGGGEAWKGLNPGIDRYVIDGLVRSIRPMEELRALRNLSRLFQGLDPDIVHLHTSKAGALGRLARGVLPARIVYTMHGFDQLRVANRNFLFVDKALRGRCGAIVAVSEHDRGLMREEGYAPLLVRNGCVDAGSGDLPRDHITSALEALRELGLPVVLMIARNAAPKRIDLARQTAALLEGRATVAWIGGDAQAGDPANFHALGSANGSAVHLRQADLFLLLSDHEGLSMSLIEAFSAGLPSVVSAIGGCLEVMGLGAAGRSPVGVAVPNEVYAVARAIEELLADRKAMTEMGRAARETWLRRFSSHQMASSYLDIYNELLRVGPGLAQKSRNDVPCLSQAGDKGKK